MVKFLDLYLYFILAITIPAVLTENTALVIIVVVLALTYGIVSLVAMYILPRQNKSPVLAENSGVKNSAETNAIQAENPWAVGLRVPYEKYLEERTEFLEYLSVIDPNEEYPVGDKKLTVRELMDEVQSQTTFGKEYIQELVEQDTEYE